jgi:hypothetical protein
MAAPPESGFLLIADLTGYTADRSSSDEGACCSASAGRPA